MLNREYSLPGPRVLRADTRGPLYPDKLCFRKDNRAPNPSTLSVCRESRAIALRRYKLCFGTDNIYADLPGGDILFLDPADLRWNWTSRCVRPGLSGRIRGEITQETLSDAVRTDLASVKHVAIPYNVWNRYDDHGWNLGAGYLLRHYIGRLGGVERVSMSTMPEDGVDRAYEGYTTIKDPFFSSPQVAIGSSGRDEVRVSPSLGVDEAYKKWRERRKRILNAGNAVRVLASFDLLERIPQEVEKGIPEARIVDLKFVPYDGPSRLREKDWWLLDRETD